MNERILLVEDEQALQMTLSDRLNSEGYLVDVASDGITGFHLATSSQFDLVILDIMLPGRNGLDVCQDIRRSGLGTPILLLSARGETADKIVGLKLGADDYVTKPFDFKELVTRVEALLRRCGRSKPHTICVIGSVRMDFASMEITREGNPVRLSAMEVRLMRYFLRHPGIGLSREKLLREVWGNDSLTSSRTLDVHVNGLRQKLENDPAHPEMIVTVKGFGYMFTSPRTSLSENYA